jgi:hypothetical protein
MKVHESVSVTAPQVFACAPQTVRDPSASVGMTDYDTPFVIAMRDSTAGTRASS